MKLDISDRDIEARGAIRQALAAIRSMQAANVQAELAAQRLMACLAPDVEEERIAYHERETLSEFDVADTDRPATPERAVSGCEEEDDVEPTPYDALIFMSCV